MTRGRQANHAYLVTQDNQIAVDVLIEALGREWIDLPAVARRDQLERVLEPPRPGEDDRRDELIRRALQRAAERQVQQRGRGQGLEL